MLRAARICSCGRRVPAGVRCECRKQRDRERDKYRGNARQRGYDAAWETYSRAYLAEHGHRYCRCGAPATLVAHIISIRSAPHLRMSTSNHRPSCHACNMRDLARDRAGGGSKVRENR